MLMMCVIGDGSFTPSVAVCMDHCLGSAQVTSSALRGLGCVYDTVGHTMLSIIVTLSCKFAQQ